jgi:hypothetical protein
MQQQGWFSIIYLTSTSMHCIDQSILCIHSTLINIKKYMHADDWVVCMLDYYMFGYLYIKLILSLLRENDLSGTAGMHHWILHQRR